MVRSKGKPIALLPALLLSSSIDKFAKPCVEFRIRGGDQLVTAHRALSGRGFKEGYRPDRARVKP